MGQIVPKWGKSGTFSDQISVHFGAVRQNVPKSDLKKSRILPISGQFDPLWGQTGNPVQGLDALALYNASVQAGNKDFMLGYVGQIFY